jgi:hypothetical protein
MAKITEKAKKPNNVYSMKKHKRKANFDVIVPYFALLASLVALAKSFHVF